MRRNQTLEAAIVLTSLAVGSALGQAPAYDGLMRVYGAQNPNKEHFLFEPDVAAGPESVMVVAIELTPLSRLDIAAANRPAITSPDNPAGSCSAMNRSSQSA